MATVVLFHSVYGRRALEREAAERLGAAGHTVVTPDLYEGRTAATVDEGFAIRHEIGWKTLTARARTAVADVPADAVLGGFSMGAAVAADIWRERPSTKGILFLHAIARIPEDARKGLPLAVHLADPDEYETPEEIDDWHKAAGKSGIDFRMYLYPGVGHLFTDRTTADYGREAAAMMWERVEGFLARV